MKHGGGFAKWSDALIHELYEWEKVGVPSGLYTQAEHDEIHLLFEKAIPYLDEITEPRLMHTDLWLGNILIRSDTEKPEFAAIIDSDRALWGDPFFKFSSIRWTYSVDSFWEGYGRPLPQENADLIRRYIYTILNLLWNSYVYLIEYNQPENAYIERKRVREQMVDQNDLLGM